MVEPPKTSSFRRRIPGCHPRRVFGCNAVLIELNPKYCSKMAATRLAQEVGPEALLTNVGDAERKQYLIRQAPPEDK